MQISQFIFGTTFAAIHLFVKYDIPIATSYKILHPVSSLLSAATSTVAEVASTASSAAVVATPTLAAYLKRLLLRAAGEEGVAENVRDPVTGHPVIPAVEEAVQRYHEETRWRNDYATVNCIDTTGQSFAVWLNIIYLLPLTALFVRFFVRAYTSRGRAKGGKHSSGPHKAGRAAIEAAKGVDREVDEPSRVAEKGINKAVKKIAGKSRNMSDEVKRDLQALKDKQQSDKASSDSNSRPSSSNGVNKSGNNKSTDNKSSNSSTTNSQTFEQKADSALQEIKSQAAAIKDEVEDELHGDEEGLSAAEDSQRPGTSDSKTEPSTPSSSSSSKKKRNKKNKSKLADSTASLGDDNTDTDAAAGADTDATSVTAVDDAPSDVTAVVAVDDESVDVSKAEAKKLPKREELVEDK